MSVPIIGEIVDSLRSAVDWTLKVTPKPILYIIFLVSLVIIGSSILPIMFNLTGTFCIDGEKFNNDFFDAPTNIQTIFLIKGLDAEANTTGVITVESICVFDVNVSGNITRYYNGAYCTNCSEIGFTDLELYYESVFVNNFGFCKEDAYRTPYENKTLRQKWFCENIFDTSILAVHCEPPPNYYFDQATGSYLCEDNDVCGNKTESSYTKYSLLEKGFVAATTSQDDKPPIVGIKCFDNAPKLALIGLDILNPVFWLILTFIGILLWVAFKFNLI